MFNTRPVSFENVNALFRLALAPGQERFVAPNVYTIAQAPYEPSAELLALYDDDTPVGLMALMDFSVDSPSLTPEDPRDGAYIWRLMVDQAHQGRGFGSKALEAAAGWTDARGLRRLYVSSVPGEGSPRPFYEANGFVFTGRMVDAEELLLRQL